MSTTASTRGGGPKALLTSSFFMKMAAVALVFVVVGFVAPVVFGENEFTGVLVGMSLSLGFIMLTVLGAVLGTAAVRSSLR